MDIKTAVNTDGTYKQGNKTINYSLLKKVFGKPTCFGNVGDKQDVEWLLDIDGTLVTIYNWKNGKCYLGEEGTPTKQIVEWNIGGKNYSAVLMVDEAIKQYFNKNRMLYRGI